MSTFDDQDSPLIVWKRLHSWNSIHHMISRSLDAEKLSTNLLKMFPQWIIRNKTTSWKQPTQVREATTAANVDEYVKAVLIPNANLGIKTVHHLFNA